MMVSGESYRIGQIFSGELVLQIPDMQRDYCWAKTISEVNGKSLVENFVNDLIEQEDTDGLQMGLLYAYESPKNHIQLCDGQQRLTTIYLLLAMLYMKTKDQKVFHALILEYEGEIIPRFQYAIRESTLTFLSDLVREVIVNEGNKPILISEIKKEDWYFKEYDNDPSVQNILIALEIIDAQISEWLGETLDDSNLKKLIALVLSKISFLYFDMVSRTYGEEQFVVLNTTGKTLTKTENMKPKFLGELDDLKVGIDGKTELRFYADLWEEWELFFWQNKNKNHQTADQALREFFRWIFIIETTSLQGALNSESEKYDEAQKALSHFGFDLLELNYNKIEILKAIQEYFIAIKSISKDINLRSNFLFLDSTLSQIQCFELLPLLSFVRINGITDINDIAYVRFKNFLRSRAMDENVSKSSITTTLEAIRISKLLSRENQLDIAVYTQYQNSVSKTLLNECEVFKFKTLTNTENDRLKIEQLFWKAEDLRTSNGSIEYLFNSLDISIQQDPDVNFNLLDFEKLVELVEVTFEYASDLMRRALLTFGDYYCHHGHTTNLASYRYDLGTSPVYFHKIIHDDRYYEKREYLIDFLRGILRENQVVNDEVLLAWYQKRIDGFIRVKDDVWAQTAEKIIKEPSIIDQMREKHFCVSYDEKESYALRQQKVTSEDSFTQIIQLD